MKRTWFWFAVVLAAGILGVLMPYLEGRSNGWWALPVLELPADLLPLLIQFAGCIILLVYLVRAIISRRAIFHTVVMFVLVVLIFAGAFMMRPVGLFHRGFHRYAETVLTPDEWRDIANVARRHLEPRGQLPGPEKNLWDEKSDRPLWSALVASTHVQRLDPSLVIYVDPDDTEIVWGGALVGHHGVVVYTKSRVKSSPGALLDNLPISDDIATFATPD